MVVVEKGHGVNYLIPMLIHILTGTIQTMTVARYEFPSFLGIRCGHLSVYGG